MTRVPGSTYLAANRSYSNPKVYSTRSAIRRVPGKSTNGYNARMILKRLAVAERASYTVHMYDKTLTNTSRQHLKNSCMAYRCAEGGGIFNV